MALADSRSAIGAVGQMLQAQLANRTSVGIIEVGRVEAAANTDGPKFNLFLYQVDIDGYLRNTPLDTGQRPPVWLALHYLLTAFDMGRDSDSVDAHNLLGEGMLALEELNYQRPTSAALADNPEPLKITFDSSDVELLSKIMQGADERYRVSTAFQVRPIMIASSEPPSYAPLVLSIGPQPDEGVVVIPSLGPVLTAVEPDAFEAGDTVTLRGEGLSSTITLVCLGDERLPVTAAPAGAVQTVIPVDTALSPGTYPVTVARELPSGRLHGSNALSATLRPTLATAAPVLPLTDDGSGNFHGDLTLTGTRLGGPTDTILVAFWRDGDVALMLEATGIATQDTLTVTVPVDEPLPAGSYRIILRANGTQAQATPEVDWS
jgi:hypothetical protein